MGKVLCKSNYDPNALHTTDKVLKYGIKRDLSGDVVFGVNCSTIGNLAVTGVLTVPVTDSGSTPNGWNFIKLPKVVFSWGATTATVVATAVLKVNGVAKTTLNLSTAVVTATVVTTLTPTTQTFQLSQASPNSLTLSGVSATPSMSMQFNSNAQRNALASIMIA